MWAYIDESGHPHPNDSCTKSVLVAVCLEEGYNRGVTRHLHNLKKDLLGDEDIEVKAHKLLRPSTLAKVPHKREFVERFFEYLQNLPLTIFAMIMPRPEQVPRYPYGILPNQYRFLLQRVNMFMQEFEGKALVIFDSGGPSSVWEGGGSSDVNLSTHITNYLFRHREGQQLDRIHEVPFFVNSKIVPGIQIADMAASCIRIHEERELYRENRLRDPFLSAIERYYSKVHDKTKDFEDEFGDQIWGFYSMSERALYAEEKAKRE